MINIYTGVIAASKKDNYTWPADWAGYEWPPITKDGIDYVTARSTDEYMTDAIKAQFDLFFDNDIDFNAWAATPVYVLDPDTNTVTLHDGSDMTGFTQAIVWVPVNNG